MTPGTCIQRSVAGDGLMPHMEGRSLGRRRLWLLLVVQGRDQRWTSPLRVEVSG
jgi:hypothetical protein